MFQLRLPIRLTARTVVIGEPKLFREILTDSSTDKPLEVYKHFANTNGGTDSIFTLNGKDWHAKRKAVAPAFSSNNIKRMTEVALKKTKAWIQDTLSSSQASFDVGKEMIAITLSAIAETAFEYSMSREEQKYFLEQLELVLIEFTFKSSSNPFRCLFGWFIPERRRAFVAARNLERLCFKIMDEYRQKGPSKENTIIKLIMESDAHESDKEKAAEMLTYWLAATTPPRSVLLGCYSSLREIPTNKGSFENLSRSSRLMSGVGRRCCNALLRKGCDFILSQLEVPFV